MKKFEDVVAGYKFRSKKGLLPIESGGKVERCASKGRQVWKSGGLKASRRIKRKRFFFCFAKSKTERSAKMYASIKAVEYKFCSGLPRHPCLDIKIYKSIFIGSAALMLVSRCYRH